MRILCIDDEPGIRSSLARVLSEHEVDCIADGCEAVRHLESGAEYDVVICDIIMANCNGIDLYRSMEKSRPELCRRMVFLTGGSLIPGVESFLDSVDCPRLDKPFSINDLHEAVRKVAPGRA